MEGHYVGPPDFTLCPFGNMAGRPWTEPHSHSLVLPDLVDQVKPGSFVEPPDRPVCGRGKGELKGREDCRTDHMAPYHAHVTHSKSSVGVEEGLAGLLCDTPKEARNLHEPPVGVLFVFLRETVVVSETQTVDPSNSFECSRPYLLSACDLQYGVGDDCTGLEFPKGRHA